MRSISPSNGAVVIRPFHTTFDGDRSAHMVGHVLSVGGGVPWLKVGEFVAFPRGAGSTFDVDPYVDVPAPPALTAITDHGTTYETVILIDQQHIHASIHENVQGNTLGVRVA